MEATEFRLPHLTLRGLRGGNPRGPLLLALHGWLDNCHSFLPLAPYLSDYDCVFVDFPGHGHSDHRGADNQYYFVDWVYDIEQLIRQQGWENIHLVGHSMGGYVAQLLTAIYPGSIARLSLIEAFGLLTTPVEETATQLREGLASRFRQQQRKKPVYSDLGHLIQARARSGDFNTELAELLLQRNLREVTGGYSWRTDSRVRAVSPFRFSVEQVTNLLQGFNTPTRLIRGEAGHQNLLQALSQWGELIADLEVFSVTGGHHVHMESPRRVAEVLR